MSRHEARHEQRRVAASDVGGVDRFRQRCQSRPQPLERSASSLLVARDAAYPGSIGSGWLRAETTTIGVTTEPSSRTTRCSMVSDPKGNIALGDPMRVDFPPQRTMPPALINRFSSATTLTH